MNDEYKLELKRPEIMKLFGSTKKLLGKTKNGENVEALGSWSTWSNFSPIKFSRHLISSAKV